jgi:hypothetical protein
MKTARQIIEPLIFPDELVIETLGEDIRFVSANDAINAMEKYAKAYHESRMKEIPEIDNDTILALPLDVPSDEEIEKKAMNHNRTDNYTTIDYYSTGIIVGSKWVRDEILKRNK